MEITVDGQASTRTATIDQYGDWTVDLPFAAGAKEMAIDASCGAVDYPRFLVTTTTTKTEPPPPTSPTSPTTVSPATPPPPWRSQVLLRPDPGRRTSPAEPSRDPFGAGDLDGWGAGR